MASPKNEKFTPEMTSLAEIAKAVSHPARIMILETLAEKNSCICGEIVHIVPLSQSTVSQHLKELKDQKIIKGEMDGVKSCYCINWDVLDKKINELTQFINKLNSLKQQKNCC
ncbi:MAG TPA: metalloregulator ArsR/SmtB family transcription factor [Ignavibacteria bacterium]|nr:metalloregulator ArsR/SmtB family transcription factor [Ignavibacteria bacterium]